LDGTERRLFDGRQARSEARRKTLEGDGRANKTGGRQRYGDRKDGVRAGRHVVTALAGRGLGGVLERLQVVGNRDYGEEDENEHRHRGSLGSPAGAARAGDT
jgi:hypothetical protein